MHQSTNCIYTRTHMYTYITLFEFGFNIAHKALVSPEKINKHDQVQ